MNLHDYSKLLQLQLTLLHCLDLALLSLLQMPPADQGLFGSMPLALWGQREGGPAGQGWGAGSVAWGLSSVVLAQVCTA